MTKKKSFPHCTHYYFRRTATDRLMLCTICGTFFFMGSGSR